MTGPIYTRPHTIRRTVKGYYDRFNHERVPDRVVNQIDADFPWFASCGSVSAIGRTRDGAVGMVERILAREATA